MEMLPKNQPTRYVSALENLKDDGQNKPNCTTTYGSYIFRLPDTKKNFVKKNNVCNDDCPVRDACLTDGINLLITDGKKPIRGISALPRAGLNDVELTSIAIEYFEQGINRIDIDEARIILNSRKSSAVA